MSKPSNGGRTELAKGLMDGFTAFSREMRLVALPPGMTRERLSTMALIDEHGPISVTDLAALAKVRVPTMSRMTSALVDDGLARKGDHKTDGRGVLLSLTAKGRRTSATATRKAVDHLSRAFDTLSDSEVAALVELTRKLETLDFAGR